VKKFEVGTVDGTIEQVTIDSHSLKIVEGHVKDGVVQLESGERVRVKDGRVDGQA
jgi:hypothetical protein